MCWQQEDVTLRDVLDACGVSSSARGWVAAVSDDASSRGLEDSEGEVQQNGDGAGHRGAEQDAERAQAASLRVEVDFDLFDEEGGGRVFAKKFTCPICLGPTYPPIMCTAGEGISSRIHD